MEFSVLLDRLRDTLRQRGLEWREVRGGIAIEFRDGCDAWFVTPDNLPSLIASTGEEWPPDALARRLADEFQRVDQTRSQVLIGLRHHAVRAKLAFLFSPDGHWGVQTESGCTTEIHVGSVLTRLARGYDPASSLVKLLKDSWLKKLSLRRAARLVALPGPPEEEYRWRESEETAIKLDPALFLSVDCSVLDDEHLELQSPEAVADALTRPRNSPGLAVVHGLRARLGEECFSVDLCAKGGADFSFADKLDQLRVFPQGKRMTRLIERHGLEGVIDLLAREYQRLDHARTRLINGLKTTMASHGYALDDCVLDRTWWFGTTHRQFPFNPRRPLTLKLRNHTPEHVLAEWLAAQWPFELPSEQELTRLCDGPPQEPARRTLPLHSPDQGPLLPAFDALDLNELDRKAAELIGLMKRQAESRDRGRTFFGADPLAWWSSPLWYRRGQEQWTDERWWMNLAKRAWDEEQHQHAALVLMLNGDDRPRAKLLEWYRQMEGYCDEACDDGVVWLLRNQIPWPLDGYGEFPRYPPVLGSPPPEAARPVALRIRHEIQTVQRGDDPDLAPDEHLDQALAEAASLDAVSGAEWLEPGEIELLHERCRRWAARTDDFFSLREEKPLDAAARFGWTDVVDVLDHNPLYGPAVLEWCFGRMSIGALRSD